MASSDNGDEAMPSTTKGEDHGDLTNSNSKEDEEEDDDDDSVDDLLAESMALAEETTEAFRRNSMPTKRLHSLETRTQSSLKSNDPNYPDLPSSDTSSPPDSNRSHIDKLERQAQEESLESDSKLILRSEGEVGDRVMSRRSTQEASSIESMFPRPPSPWVGRLNSATMNNDCARLSASSTFCTDGLNLDRFAAPNLHHPGNDHDDNDVHDAIFDENNQISDEMKALFQYIDAYKPQEVEIAAILKPFIPDYILAVGAIDEFIKVPRPDNHPDYLGIKVLDESAAKQSDPAVLTLQLRAASTQPSLHSLEVSSIENAHKNPKKVDAWINSIKDLHRAKPPPSVIYSKPMPEIDTLLQEWSPDIEKVLADIELPTSKLDVDLPTFVDICCSILDIPVYKSRVESLHVMFSLYLELKNSLAKFSSADSEWESKT